MSGGVLVAGIGNLFLGDDAFGVEVARRMALCALPAGVEVADFGIRGLHLAYELLERDYATAILVDALPRGGAPGTVYVLEPDLEALGRDAATPDAHTMDPAAVLRWLRSLGGTPRRVLIVGCEPARTEEEIGLSEPVAAAVQPAIDVILRLAREAAGGETTSPGV